MSRKQTASRRHENCRRIAAVRFSGDNFICAGENGSSHFTCDNVRLCIRGRVVHRTQEMTIREARTIRDCLSAVIRDLSGRGMKQI